MKLQFICNRKQSSPAGVNIRLVLAPGEGKDQGISQDAFLFLHATDAKTAASFKETGKYSVEVTAQ